MTSTERAQPEASSIRRVLILGHSGFVGSRLTDRLRTQASGLQLEGRSFPPTDLTREEEMRGFQQLFDLNTAVVMLAGVKRQLGDNLDTFQQNLQMVANLCRVLQERPVGRLLYFSSAAVYGEDTHNLEFTEETPVRPVSFYGIAKFSSECLVRKVFAGRPGSSLVILRPTLIYGPGDQGIYGPSGFVKAAVRGEKIGLWGDGTELREFLFVDDVVELAARLLFHPFSGVLNPVSGRSHSFKEVLEIVEARLQRSLAIEVRPRSKIKADNGFDNRLLKEILPDFVFTSLAEGVARTLSSELNAAGVNS